LFYCFWRGNYGVKIVDASRRHSSIAKITRPSLKGIVPRERLFQHLDTCRDKPVIWITGPPGSGKTTLAASYLDSRKLPCLWYQLNEGDADISTFFYYLGMAAKKAATKRKKTLPLLTPEYMLGITTFTLRYFEELFSRLNTPQVLVFDNYQTVSPDSKLHEVISHGMSVIPEKINIIVLSRREPPPQLVALRANDKMSSLGWNELSFTIEESRVLISLRGRKELKDEALTKLYDKIKGWAAGLVLTLEAAKIRPIDYQMLDTLTPKEVFDYFAGEIFEKTDKETQDFLLRTSFLPRMPEQLVEKLTGFSKAGQILSHLSQNHFFTEKSHHSAPSYQYHPLFREFLLRNAEMTFPIEDILALRKTAAGLLEEAGHIEDAAELMIDAGSWEGLAQMICKNAPSLLSQGRGRTLEEWLNKIPEEALDKVPWLLYWRGICRMPFNPAESRLHLEKAFLLFNDHKDSAGILLSWSGTVDSIINAWDDFSLLDYWIEWLEKHLIHNQIPSPEIETRVTYSMTAALIQRQPHHPDIRKWIERSSSFIPLCRNVVLNMQAFAHMVTYNSWIGDFANNLLIAEKIKKMITTSEVPPFLLIFWKANEAMIYGGFVEYYALSFSSVAEGLEIADKYGVHVLDAMLFSHGVYGSLYIGDMAMAKKYLEKVAAVANGSQRNLLCLYHFLSAWYSLLLGDLAVSEAHGEKAVSLCKESGMLFPEIVVNHVMSVITHQQGEYQRAKIYLDLAMQVVQKTGSRYFQYVCLLTQAEFALDRNDQIAGLENLRKAMALGKEQGYFLNAFNWRLRALSRLCAKALEAGIEVDYVQDLIRKLKLLPDSSFPEIETWPYPLRIYTLGRFEIVKDGAPLRFSGKVQKKPIEMLKAIISLGGRDVNEDQLMDFLWPEAPGDTANLSFRTTLHRLRKMIGIDEAVQSGERRLALDQQYCRVDIQAFQRATKRIADLWKEKNRGNINLIIDLSEKAVSMYKGDFLSADDTLPWTFTMRERLREKYIRLVNMLGHCCEETGQWERAVECYKKALDADILQEEFYRYLMLCYEKLGRHAEALRTYDRCRNAFHTMLGVEPSSKTEEIARRLRK
jgi:LuxR family transcriptional regulator, maltose regulon positive regulatory protein